MVIREPQDYKKAIYWMIRMEEVIIRSQQYYKRHRWLMMWFKRPRESRLKEVVIREPQDYKRTIHWMIRLEEGIIRSPQFYKRHSWLLKEPQVAEVG